MLPARRTRRFFMEATVSRRSFVGAMAGAGVLVSQQRSSILAAPGRASSLTSRAAQDAPDGPYTLPDLPYDYAALESHIDTLTMQTTTTSITPPTSPI